MDMTILDVIGLVDENHDIVIVEHETGAIITEYARDFVPEGLHICVVKNIVAVTYKKLAIEI